MAGDSKNSEDHSMKTDYSTAWKKSTQPRKQRKYRYNAPFHTVTSFLSVNLSKDLRKKHGMRSIPLRKGDKVKIARGTHKGKTGTIEKVSRKLSKAFIAGIEQTRIDGNKHLIPFEPSNLLITDLDLKDKKRIKAKQEVKKTIEENKSGKETPEKA